MILRKERDVCRQFVSVVGGILTGVVTKEKAAYRGKNSAKRIHMEISRYT